MTTKSATIDGIEMRWEEHGTGTPLVLVHGIPASPALWRHVVPRLEGCRCEEAFSTHWPHYEAHGGAADFVRQVQALDNADTRAIEDDLPALDRPARIVWGVADQFQKINYGERLARDLDASLRRIEDGKHFTPENFPEVVAEEIMALVAATSSAA